MEEHLLLAAPPKNSGYQQVTVPVDVSDK
jgi:hypothetical protein